MSSNIKPKTGGLAAILRLERERRAQEEKEIQSTPISAPAPSNITPAAKIIPASNIIAPTIFEPPTKIVAPIENAPPSIIVAPTEFEAGTKRTGQPLRNEPAKESVAPTKIKGVTLLPADAPHLRTPHEITDRILPTLKPGCQVVLMRLYRLSAGFGSDTCHVSLPKLASACNISETQIRVFLRDLEQRKLIKRLSVDLSNKIQSERGITFEVLLPRLGATKSTAGVKIAGGMEFTGGADSEPNKVSTQKESTQTQEPAAGVRGGSKFTIEECRSYAKHLQETGQGINNPGGYATIIHRTGEADLLIESFLNPPAPVLDIDASQCLDCKGSGFYYPNGPSSGVAKCRHEKLTTQS
jgi:hypothetical protein